MNCGHYVKLLLAGLGGWLRYVDVQLRALGGEVGNMQGVVLVAGRGPCQCLGRVGLPCPHKQKRDDGKRTTVFG